jgi:hypothetical protein
MVRVVCGVLLLGGVVGLAEPYWFDFEFDDPNNLPQGEAWHRRYQPEPFGVVENGILTYDSNDPRSYDFFEYHRPGALDPAPGQIFLCEWRLWTGKSGDGKRGTPYQFPGKPGDTTLISCSQQARSPSPASRALRASSAPWLSSPAPIRQPPNVCAKPPRPPCPDRKRAHYLSVRRPHTPLLAA